MKLVEKPPERAERKDARTATAAAKKKGQRRVQAKRVMTRTDRAVFLRSLIRCSNPISRSLAGFGLGALARCFAFPYFASLAACAWWPFSKNLQRPSEESENVRGASWQCFLKLKSTRLAFFLPLSTLLHWPLLHAREFPRSFELRLPKSPSLSEIKTRDREGKNTSQTWGERGRKATYDHTTFLFSEIYRLDEKSSSASAHAPGDKVREQQKKKQ